MDKGMNSMSVVFLDCDYLRQSFNLTAPCCDYCHANHQNCLIYIRPETSEGKPDWLLCVEAIVCCNLYHFVKNIPRNWWESKAIEYGVARDDQRGYIFPGVIGKEDAPSREIKKRQRRSSSIQPQEERSFQDFLKRR